MTPLHLGDFTLRPAEPRDRAAVYAVCLHTGDSGREAAHLYSDPDALGNVYAGPYLALEPRLAWVLEDAAGVCGYLLGALDTAQFHARMLADWLPPLRAQRPAPAGDPAAWSLDQQVWNLYHHPEVDLPPACAAYPSHAHIDLLPRAQGRGLGRLMMGEMLAALARLGSPGIHLAVAHDNLRATHFYSRLGFTELARTAGARYLGRHLP